MFPKEILTYPEFEKMVVDRFKKNGYTDEQIQKMLRGDDERIYIMSNYIGYNDYMIEKNRGGAVDSNDRCGDLDWMVGNAANLAEMA